MFVLEVQNGKYKGRRLKLIGDQIYVGRDEDCAVRIGSSEVSRRHCMLILRDDQVTVRDLESRNGTLINDVPIAGDTVLEVGGAMSIGPMTFRLLQLERKPRRRRLPVDDLEPLSDVDIATWLTAGESDTSTDLAGVDTSLVGEPDSTTATGTPADPAPPSPSAELPKRRDFKSVAEEAADILRRHFEKVQQRNSSDDAR